MLSQWNNDAEKRKRDGGGGATGGGGEGGGGKHRIRHRVRRDERESEGIVRKEASQRKGRPASSGPLSKGEAVAAEVSPSTLLILQAEMIAEVDGDEANRDAAANATVLLGMGAGASPLAPAPPVAPPGVPPSSSEDALPVSMTRVTTARPTIIIYPTSEYAILVRM